MSKSTSKQKYIQLKEWLNTRGTSTTATTTGKPRRFSKSDHYKQTRKRYGNKGN